jgi:type II secretory pathway pseudopilin PulG
MRGARGFTLVEMLVATAFFMTVTGMAMALLGSALPSIRADTEANRLISMLQVARETAIARQRDVEVRIDEDTEAIRLVRIDEGVEVPMAGLVFENRMSLLQFDGMGDTPDGFGDDDRVDFGGADALIFAPDGSFIADDDVPLNGTFFLGISGKPETARAVTITGTTGRPRLYRWQTGGWVAR